MRHRATRPFLDLLHRLPRVLARPVGALSRLGSLRFAAGLLAAMVVGTGAFVAVASMGDGSEDPVAGAATPVDRTGSEASRSAERPDLPESSPAGSLSPSPSTTPAKKRTSQDAESPRPPAPQASEQDPAEDVTAEVQRTRPDPASSPSTPDAGSSSPPSDRSAPQTSLSASYPSGDAATFSFGADEAATFACSLDGAPFTSCTSPAGYSDLDPGRHTFRVRATDSAGNVDPTPASVTWQANRGPSVDD